MLKRTPLISTRLMRIFTALGFVCSLFGSTNAIAEDCSVRVHYVNSSGSNRSKTIKVDAGKIISRRINGLNYISNRGIGGVRVRVTKVGGLPGSKKWVTLGLNSRDPSVLNYPPYVNLYKIRCPAPAVVPNTSCPTGLNGKVCNGDGNCVNGSCQCRSSDYSGSSCAVISQRCYGAIGNNCGHADAAFNPGLCIGNRCKINAGSWKHDECCIRYRRNGPMPANLQGSCSPPPAPAPYVSQCLQLFNKAAAELGSPGLTWERQVNTHKKESGTGFFSVRHADMCNKSGGTLRCSEQKYCCSKRAAKTKIAGVCKCQ